MFKIMQYNIFFGRINSDTEIDIINRMKLLSDQILINDPDVVCLQEAIQPRYAEIMKNLESVYRYRYPENITQRYDTAILSKHPIVNAGKYRYSVTDMQRSVRYIIIEVMLGGAKKKICVATSHFESEFGSTYADIQKKIFQYSEAEDLLDKIISDNHNDIQDTFFCADFNASDSLCDYKLYNAFKYDPKLTIGENWRDAWIESSIVSESDEGNNSGNNSDNKRNENTYTYDSYTNPMLLAINSEKKYRSRLDRIIYKSRLYVNNFYLAKSDEKISDHYPIVVEFGPNEPSNYQPYFNNLQKIFKLSTQPQRNHNRLAFKRSLFHNSFYPKN